MLPGRNGSAWGSSLIAGDTGILLNNRMTYWHLEENHVDCLQPGKRGLAHNEPGNGVPRR